LKSFRGQISGADISAYWEFYFCYQRCPTSAKFPQSVSARPRLISCLVAASDETKKVVETAVAGKKGEKETKKPAGMNN